MSEISNPPGFDLVGAARDWDAFVKMATPLWSRPRMVEAMRLLHRNPELAPAVEDFILGQPGATALDQPLNWNPSDPTSREAG